MQIRITENQFNNLKYSCRKQGQLDCCHKLNENNQDEVDSDDVSLDSFYPKDALADSIWSGQELNPRVRLTLLDIADDFIEFLKMDWVDCKDIVLTGSICNYNWSDYSDIDVHIIYDFSEIDDNADLVRSYVDAKKNEWMSNHEDLEIYGFSVEMYVENCLDKGAVSSGRYSLEKNKWLSKPSKDDIELHSNNEIKDLSAEIMTMIDDIEVCYEKAETDGDLESLDSQLEEICEIVKAMRKSELEKHGEMAVGNIVYKVLRREGYLDKLYGLRNSIYDEINSI